MELNLQKFRRQKIGHRKVIRRRKYTSYTLATQRTFQTRIHKTYNRGLVAGFVKNIVGVLEQKDSKHSRLEGRQRGREMVSTRTCHYNKIT